MGSVRWLRTRRRQPRSSYEAGAFHVPEEDQPGPSGIAKIKPRKRKGQTAKPDEMPAEEMQPAKRRRQKTSQFPG